MDESPWGFKSLQSHQKRLLMIEDILPALALFVLGITMFLTWFTHRLLWKREKGFEGEKIEKEVRKRWGIK